MYAAVEQKARYYGSAIKQVVSYHLDGYYASLAWMFIALMLMPASWTCLYISIRCSDNDITSWLLSLPYEFMSYGVAIVSHWVLLMLTVQGSTVILPVLRVADRMLRQIATTCISLYMKHCRHKMTNKHAAQESVGERHYFSIFPHSSARRDEAITDTAGNFLIIAGDVDDETPEISHTTIAATDAMAARMSSVSRHDITHFEGYDEAEAERKEKRGSHESGMDSHCGGKGGVSRPHLISFGLLGLATVGAIAFHLALMNKVPRSYIQSFTALQMCFRMVCDATIAFIMCTYLILHCVLCRPILQKTLDFALRHKHCSSSSCRRRRWAFRLFPILGTAFVVLIVAVSMLARLPSVDTVAYLQQSLDGKSFDLCAAEGMELRVEMAQSPVLPLILPRRYMNFYMGSEHCHSSSWLGIAYVDELTDTLVISSICRGGGNPRVFLERLDRMDHRCKTKRGEYADPDGKYLTEMNTLYGTPEKAEAEKVVVRKRGGSIMSVEIRPDTLVPVKRRPSSSKEEAVRLGWPSIARRGSSTTVEDQDVLEVRLGRSPAYTVTCPGHEEYYVYPVNPALRPNFNRSSLYTHTPPPPAPAALLSPPNETAAAAIEEPAGNVLMLLFDAVSKQTFVNSLPKTVAWIRSFQHQRQFLQNMRNGAEHRKHLVIESKGHTIYGRNTCANLTPYLAGATMTTLQQQKNKGESNDTLQSYVQEMAKVKYGDMISTSYTSDLCEHIMEDTFGTSELSAGNGRPFQGIDFNLYNAFCHSDYHRWGSSFMGPYGMSRRCIADRHVHEYALEYTAALLRHQLNDTIAVLSRTDSHTQGSKRKFFFDVTHFIEGHETSITVIGLMDDALVEFFSKLDVEMGFFNDPLNVLIVAGDHGLHMGYYNADVLAGQYEHSTPPMVYFIHPDVLDRVDERKGRPAGTALANMRMRTQRLSTPFDTYMTICDLAGVEPAVFPPYMEAEVPPASLFDARQQRRSGEAGSAPIQRCSDFWIGTREERRFFCALDFCKRKE